MQIVISSHMTIVRKLLKAANLGFFTVLVIKYAKSQKNKYSSIYIKYLLCCVNINLSTLNVIVVA